jgi:prepilin-type N-terminal cleavage/methylation domain-containing protein
MGKTVEPGVTLTSRTGSKRGFTTIELMVTLTLMALMSGLVVVSMGPALREAKLRSGCRIVASALIYARSYAVTHRAYTRVVLDKSEGTVSVLCQATNERGEAGMQPILTQPGRRHKLPQGIEILAVRKSGVEEEQDLVSFSQLGQSEDAVIVVEGANGKERRITVDAVTGRCAVESGKANEGR